MCGIHVMSAGRISDTRKHVHHLFNTAAAFTVLISRLNKALTRVHWLVQKAVKDLSHTGSFFLDQYLCV